MLFFFKQKTAYEMRISDWSSDVCSSDLALGGIRLACNQVLYHLRDRAIEQDVLPHCERERMAVVGYTPLARGGFMRGDRKSVVEGKSVSVSVDLGGRRVIKEKNHTQHPSSDIIQN